MANHLGLRSTYQTAATENRQIRVVDQKIADLEPNEAPLLTLMLKLNKREPTPNPSFEWYERDFTPRWAQLGSTTVSNTTSANTISVLDATLFVAGEIWAVPRAVSVSTHPELIRVTSVNTSTNVITVTRAFASTSIDTISASASLRLAGAAELEGAAVPDSKSSTPTVKTSYTQIFRTAIDPLTWTALSQRNYGTENGGERKDLQRLGLIEHKIRINSALLFGKSASATSGENYLRTTQGLFSTISTNIYNMNGTLTMKAMESWCRMAFRYGPKKKILLADPLMTSALSQWANNYIQLSVNETKFGVAIKTWRSPHGELMIVNDWMLENGVSGQNGFAGRSAIVDLDQITYMYLAGNGYNRDTKLLPDVKKDGQHRVVDEYYAEVGFKIKREQYHSFCYNYTDYAA
mgnify:CR=1 FL=1